MSRIFTTILAAMCLFVAAAATKSAKSPDFAFPTEVTKQAEADLAKAIKSDNTQGTINALIRIGLAQSSISADNVVPYIARIEEMVQRHEGTVEAALLRVLLAQVYKAYYDFNSYNLDNRTTVEGELPDDITLWSGDQFKMRIDQLLMQAVDCEDALRKAPLADYTSIITSDAISRRFYPTLFDFVCYTASQMLRTIDTGSFYALPARMAYEAVAADALPVRVGVYGRHAVEVLNRWVAANPRPTSARIEALIAYRKIMMGICVASESSHYDDILALYHANDTTPYAIELILDYINDTRDHNEDDDVRFYDLLEDFEHAHPDYFNINGVRNLISRLSRPDIYAAMPDVAPLGRQQTIKCSVSNVNDFDIYVYRAINPDVKESTYRYTNGRGLECVDTLHVHVDGTVPFSTTTEVPVTFDRYGRYLLHNSLKPFEKNREYSYITVTDLGVMTRRIGDNGWVAVVDTRTGRGVDHARLDFFGNRRRTVISATNYTDAAGFYRGPIDQDMNRMLYSAADDSFCAPYYDYSSTLSYSNDEKRSAIINTDLAVYHPGDTVQFVAIRYVYTAKSKCPDAFKKSDVVFYDANFQPIDTLSLTTDNLGRLTGRFAIPKQGLTGSYALRVREAGKVTTYATHYVTVSDYKLPTYQVTVDKPVLTDDGGIRFTGRAVAYSGFPMADASVDVVFTNSYNWWYYSTNKIDFATASVSTAADGSFELTLTPSQIDTAPYPTGIFTADVTVVSPTGEMQTATARLSRGLSQSISINIPGQVTVIPGRVNTLSIGVIDALYASVRVPMHISIKGADTECTYDVDSTTAGTVSLDLSQLPSGSYTVTVTADGVDKSAEANTVVYNTSDNADPAPDQPLWVLDKRYKVDLSAPVAHITFATPEAGRTVFVAVQAPDRMVDFFSIESKGGIETLDVTIPDYTRCITVTLLAAYDGDYTTDTVDVITVDPAETVKISIEHLRTSVVPGDKETITLSITDASGSATQAGVILDIYNKALDEIEQGGLSGTVYSINPYIQPMNCAPESYSYSIYYRPLDKYLPTVDYSAPEYYLYGRSFMPLYLYSRKYRLSAAANYDEGVYMDADDMVAVKSSVAQSTMGSANLADEGEEEYEEDYADEVVPPHDDISYRPAEIPLALFEPMLTTDADGRLTVKFTVPDANTTWVLSALAYSEAMGLVVKDAEIVAAKPVMVQPNMPRFVRNNDRVVVPVMSINNSDATAEIITRWSVANASDGTVIASGERVGEVGEMASRIDDLTFTAPADAMAVVVRCSARAGIYTDAVEIVVPVLPDSQPVIESQTFYLAPDQKSYSTDVDVDAADAVVTLSFCENPTWEVVAALPGLLSTQVDTSLGASVQIFAAQVSAYVLSLNPAIETRLKAWLKSSTDAGEMLSKLEQNDDLKQLVLASTPWVQEAADDADRMLRLALLFDRKNIAKAVDDGFATLTKLEAPDGGWCWTANYDTPSLWMTLQILNNFAELRQLGCYPDRLDKMVSRALKYADAEVAKQYDRYPSGDYRFYTYVRALYPEVKQSTAAAAVSKATVNQMLAEWRKVAVGTKAAYALTLYRSGYKNVAAQILESIRDFAIVSPQWGMSWDALYGSSWWSLNSVGQTSLILEAFNLIDPGCADIDKIRQWLILNKVVQDWGSSVNASAWVASILQCGTDWLNHPGDVKIKLAGKSVKVDKADKLTGAFVTDLARSGNLTITRSAQGPAWGAVITRMTRSMDSIAAAALPELSITKQVLVSDNDGRWVELGDATATVGQTMRVRLIISANRDMDYVTIVDNRAAALEPLIQTPQAVYCDGLVFYLEQRDATTDIFIDRLFKGQYIIEYDMSVNNAGTYASGVATIQSQYAPELTAHSASRRLTVAPRP